MYDILRMRFGEGKMALVPTMLHSIRPSSSSPRPLPATRRMPVPAGLAASSAPNPLTRSSGYFSAFRTSVKERDSYEYQA
jgi:hypothetical protein